MNIHFLDIIVGIILAYSVMHGYSRGIVQQLGSLGGLIVAILFANLFTPIFENLLVQWFDMGPSISHKLAYLITFLLLMFGCYFIAKILKKTLTMLHLGWFDRILGSIFCGFKYLLIISVLFNLYTLLSDYPGSAVPPIPKKAQLSQIVTKVAPYIIDWSKEEIKMPDVNISLPEINKDDFPTFLQ